MSNVNVTKLGDAAQANDPEHRADHIRRDQYDTAINSRMSADEIKAVGLTVGGVGGALFFLLWTIKGVTCWRAAYMPPSGECTFTSGLFYLYVLALVVGGVATPVFLLWGRMARTRAEVMRATLTRDRYSNPVSAMTIHQQGQRAAAGYFLAAQKAEIAMAPYKALPAGLDAYSVSNSSAAPAPNDTPPEQSGPDIGPLLLEDWMQRLDEQPHAIFAAKTKGGKSTMAKVGLKARIENKESIFIIDPHSNGWLDLPGVGGGLDWDSIESAMAKVVQLYRDRMEERERYLQENGRELPQDFFPRVTVIFDEANEARLEIEKRHTAKTSPWQPFVQIMGSGARKVGISLWLICQSALIKNLGGSTVMRRNFTVFALDHETIRELVEDEEPLPTRRQAIIERIGGSSYPAATVLNGQAFLLDRVGLDRLQPASAAGCAWAGWNYSLRPKMPPRSVVSASVQSVPSASLSIPAQSQRQTDAQTRKMPADHKKALLRYMRAKGMDRDAARIELRAMGEGLDNDDWTDAK